MGLTGFNRRRRAVAAAGAHDASAAAAPLDAVVTALDVPPREGRGAGKQAWVDFAASIELAHDADATRDDIIALFDARVAENDAALAAARLSDAEDESASNDGDDTQTAEAGAGDGSEHDGDVSHE